MLNRRLLAVLMVLLGASAPVFAADAIAAQSGFVTVKGKHFQLDGKPYYYAGANLWYGMYLGSPGKTGNRVRLVKELDQLASQGITNLRVLAISEHSTLKRAVTPAVVLGPDHLDETLWQGLDFLLAEMAKRDMKAVLYVNNFWQWSGGMATYVSWSTGKAVADPDVTGDWNTYINTSASFYRDARAQGEFRFALKQLIARKNSVSGRMYVEDPTIMSWQLANEPRPGVDGDSTYFEAFSQWIADTAALIKTLAPRQLVSTGSEGWMGTAGSRDLYVKSHTPKSVDYLTFHMWAPNWQWFDPKNAAVTYDGAWTKMQDYLNWHIDTANKMGKPIVLEEFGINRDEGSFRPVSTTVYRDKFYTAVYGLLARRAAAGDAIAGSNFWAWGGVGRTRNADFMWKAGDSFVGDPPQEPQGLYCVFDSDVSTVRIIATHSRQMSDLR
ncbi:MAG TPA: cellulase family glycosylhydrolase [Steroidobacteraceae bacterium]|jgi:mannan endo-1,4-beta-mannosidase|nr:cellulase family glycosylhydrolase [Steroidobacteraceae bacterium]